MFVAPRNHEYRAMSNQWPPSGNPNRPNFDNALQPETRRDWQPPAPQHTPAHPKGNKQLTIVATLIVVIAGLLTAGGLMLVNGGDSSAEVSADFIVTGAEVSPPVFEPRMEEGDDAFFPLNLQLAGFEEAVGVMPTDADIESGLFGGTAEETCDPERLIEYLYANPSQGEVWAQVQGIEFNQIADYIRSLEARVLAESAVVLNHGFTNGAATEFEATLEAGTAVLVDAEGNIRTRCYCGNPITPKPIVYKQPRCVVNPLLVYTGPGGKDPIQPPSQDVTATGQVATKGDGDWVELDWFNGQGWTPVTNVRENNCPPPIVHDYECPGPGEIPVWATSAGIEQVGRLNGTIFTETGASFINASIDRVGGATGSVEENGFTLIRFTQGDFTANTAWLRLSDLGSDTCGSIPACINLTGQAFERPFVNPYVGNRGPGIYQVQFTGKFADHPTASWTEVRFVDDGGDSGWIDPNGYSALPATACGVVDDDYGTCYVPIGDVERLIYSEPSGAGAALGITFGAIVFPLDAAPVFAPSERSPEIEVRWIQAQIAGGGPIGWFNSERLDSDSAHCAPVPRCIDLMGPVWADFDRQGANLDSEPGIQLAMRHGFVSFDGASDPEEFIYQFAVDGGPPGWIHAPDFEWVLDTENKDCQPDHRIGDEVCMNIQLYPTPEDAAADQNSIISGDDYIGDVVDIEAGGLPLVRVRTSGPTGYAPFDPDPPHSCVDLGEHLCIAPIMEMWPSFPPTGPATESPDAAWGLLHDNLAYLNQDYGAPFAQVEFDAGGTFWFRPGDDGADAEPEECGPIGDEPPTDERFGPCGTPTAGDAPDVEEACCVTGNYLPLTGNIEGFVPSDLVPAPRPGGIAVNWRPGGPGSSFEYEGETWHVYVVQEPDFTPNLIAAPASSITALCEIFEVLPDPDPTPTPTPTPTPNVPPPPGDTVVEPPRAQPTPTPTPTPTPEPTPTPRPCDDVDGDGICDDEDTCIDRDRDLHCDNADNCPNVYDPGQTDSDGDGIGDVCDDDNGIGDPPPDPGPTPDPDPDRFDTNQLIGLSRAEAEARLPDNWSFGLTARHSPCIDNPDTICTAVFELSPPPGSRQNRVLIEIQLPFPNGGQIISARIG